MGRYLSLIQPETRRPEPTKETNLTKKGYDDDLEASSMRRLEAANIYIAVLEDGTLRLVQSEADAHQAALDGYTIYSPRDAYYYIQLEPHERRMLHDFKRTFGGTTNWREA